MTANPEGTRAQRRPRHPRRSETWMVDQLPEWMLVDPFLVNFVSLFQSIADTHLAHVDQLEHVFDPSVAPPQMVQLMTRWIGFESVDDFLPPERQRRLLQQLAGLWRHRGTEYGLTMLLEAVTGERVRVEDSGGIHGEGQAPRGPPRVVIHLESTGGMYEGQLVGLVRRELPVGVAFDLVVADRGGDASDVGEATWP